MSEVEDLISTLVDHTRNGDIRWEQADARARKFVAKRESGTVVISGPGTDLVPISIIPTKQGIPAVTLEVLDAAGKTVEEVEYVPASGFMVTAGTFDPPALKQVLNLYDLVKEQVLRSKSTMRSLAAEFKKPEPGPS